MNLKEFVKMFKNNCFYKEKQINEFENANLRSRLYTKGSLSPENETEPSTANTDQEQPTKPSVKEPTPPQKNKKEFKCFSQKGHNLSFQEAAYLVSSHARLKNLIDYPIIQYDKNDEFKGEACTPEFVSAIKSVQADLGFKGDDVDGIIGKNTIKALERASSKTSDKKKKTAIEPAGAVTIVGDSIATCMAVAYANQGLGYPECKGKNYVSCKLPMAAGGKHTFQILSMVRSNLSKDKQSKSPGLMIVSAGTNDALAYSADRGNFTPEDTLSKIDQISQFATAAGYKVKFKTIDPIRGGSKVYIQEKYNEFAEKVNNTLTSKYETFSGSKIPLRDIVHPTRQGSVDLLKIAMGEIASTPVPKPVKPVKQKDIEDSSRPRGNAKYVDFIEQNLEIVESFCQNVLGIEFSFTTDGLKNFQKAAGFAGETRTFDYIKKGKPATRTIEGQIDGKIGPHTMTAMTLLYFINQSGPKVYATNKLEPNRMFESSALSLKERLENNLQKLTERTDITSFEQFANTKYFKNRVAPTHTSMKVQNPSIPPLAKIKLPFDGQSLIEEKYEIHEGVGITKKYGTKKIELIKVMIDQIKSSMPKDAHSPEAIIAILGVCGKESAFGPTKEGTKYRFSNIKKNLTGNAVAGRVNGLFFKQLKRYPTDDEIRAITGGGPNGIALFNMAYGYDGRLQTSGYDKSSRKIPASLRVVVEDPNTGETKINPALYNPQLAGFKYRGHGAVQMTGYGNYRYLEKIASDEGGKVAKMFKGVKDNPELVIKTPEHNVISSIMYMNFPHAKKAIARAKQKEGETQMEFLVRKYASGPFGSTIGQKYKKNVAKKGEKARYEMREPSMQRKINGQINLSAASNKTAKFIIVGE